MLNSEDMYEINEAKEKTRRGFFLGLLSGAVVSTVLGKSQTAKADIYGGDTASMTTFFIWVKSEYLIIAPYLKTIKDNYDAVKGYVKDFNDFVTQFNTAMGWLLDLRTFLTQPQQNIFYMQYRQMVEYYDSIMKQKNNDLLTFRLHHFNPVMIEKIDSTTAQIENLFNRARAIVSKNMHSKKEDGINPVDTSIFSQFSQGNEEEINTNIRKTKKGRTVIRMSNDNAKYIQAISNLQGIRESIKKIKNEILPKYMEKNKTKKSSMEVYNEMITPKILETLLLQTSINIEMYQKYNDLLMILSNEAPLISDNEKLVTRNEIKELLKQIKEDGSEIEKSFIS